MPLNEETIVDQIASQERAIAGIRNSYGFADNPEVIQHASLPAVVHYIPSFDMSPRGHYNAWNDVVTVRSLLLVSPREDKGGKLKFLENDAIPYGRKWRDRFQIDTVIRDLLATTSATKAFLASGEYGAGGRELTYNGVEFIGWVFTFVFQSA